MLLVLFGKDGYRLRRRLKAIEERHKSLSPVSVHKEEWEGEADTEHLKRTLHSPSIFREKRLLVLKNASDQVVSFLEEQGELLKKDEDTILVLVEESLPKEVSALALKYAALIEEFSPLSGKELDAWIAKLLKTLSLSSPLLARRLRDCCGSDLWRAEQEARKLAAYGKDHELTREALDSLLPLPRETKIFATLDAISAKNAKQALRLLSSHEQAGDADLYVLSMMQYQTRNLLAAAEEKTSSSLKKLVSPRMFPQFKLLARGFRIPELKALHHALWKIDLAAKRGERDVYQALEILVARITSSPA